MHNIESGLGLISEPANSIPTENFSWYGLFILIIFFVVTRTILTHLKKERPDLGIKPPDSDNGTEPAMAGKCAMLIRPTPVLQAGASKVIGKTDNREPL